jgi:hypothetical protein
MSGAKIEVFLSPTPSSSDNDLSKLLDGIQREFNGDLEIVYYKGRNELFDEYNITATPAVVIEEMIKIMGFCPSKETLVYAIKGGGLK